MRPSDHRRGRGGDHEGFVELQGSLGGWVTLDSDGLGLVMGLKLLSQESPWDHRPRPSHTTGSAVLLVEATLAEDARGPLPALLLSLNMAVQTRGRERTEAQYRAMAAAAGFPHFQASRPATGVGVEGGWGPYATMLAWK